MKRIFFLLALLCPFFAFSHIRPLTIGDSVDNVILPHLTNAKLSSGRLYDFRKDLIILDFWNSNCGSCIALFPHLDSLQDRFDERLQIVLMNTKSKRVGDDAPTINRILDKVRKRTGAALTLPVAFDNPTLDSMFPCKIIPHEVWIYKGRIVAITDAKAVNQSNITQILEGKTLQLPVKIDELAFDYEQPLFQGTGSLFMSEKPGIGATAGVRNNHNMRAKYYLNHSLYSLVIGAYHDSVTVQHNRIVVSEEAKVIIDSFYCYELHHPELTDSLFQILLRQDLLRYFGLAFRTEVRSVRCLTLTPGPNIIPSRHSEPSFDLAPEVLRKYVYHHPPEKLSFVLNLFSYIPIINELPGKTPVSIDLPRNIHDIPAMQKAFAAKGIILTDSIRPVTVQVITRLTR